MNGGNMDGVFRPTPEMAGQITTVAGKPYELMSGADIVQELIHRTMLAVFLTYPSDGSGLTLVEAAESARTVAWNLWLALNDEIEPHEVELDWVAV